MTRRIELSLWIASAALLLLTAAGWRSGTSVQKFAGSAVTAASGAAQLRPVSGLDGAASRIVGTDPFRLDRRPSLVAFGEPAVVPAPNPMRRPILVLSGVIGPPWQAVLDGIPGREGSVVARVGDVFGDLRVRSIRRDTVVVQGADTTWKLTVRHVW